MSQEFAVAVECFADKILWEILKAHLKYLSLSIVHRGGTGKGRVVKMVFENKSYPLGMIDEDPGTGQPSALAGSTLMKRLDYADLIKKENRHLIILKPRLEDCHCRTMRLLKGCSVLGGNFSEVHEKLNHSDTRKKDFDDFRQELRDILWAKQGYLQDVLALFAVCVPNR